MTAIAQLPIWQTVVAFIVFFGGIFLLCWSFWRWGFGPWAESLQRQREDLDRRIAERKAREQQNGGK